MRIRPEARAIIPYSSCNTFFTKQMLLEPSVRESIILPGYIVLWHSRPPRPTKHSGTRAVLRTLSAPRSTQYGHFTSGPHALSRLHICKVREYIQFSLRTGVDFSDGGQYRLQQCHAIPTPSRSLHLNLKSGLKNKLAAVTPSFGNVISIQNQVSQSQWPLPTRLPAASCQLPSCQAIS